MPSGETTNTKEQQAAPTLPSRGDPATLSPGSQFGAYEILSPIGAGGMGEVYRARDTRLGREVAIKILSGNLCPDRERVERFQQEARSASALNHPNIVTIYELGQVEDTCYIAMELVEGEVLRELLGSGSIPLQKVIQIAAQVADGLAKAHEAGMVHRDLKPENLMVSRDGFVKILDFGLAKLAPPMEAESFDTRTLGGLQTLPGTVMGTIEYMSPEQASGRPVDFRSDQFSFGSVLYEMVTGKPAFQRGSKAETLAAILRDDPEPIGALNPEAPAPLCWVIERCLDKKPEQRYASTRELVRDLAAMRDRLSEVPIGRPETRPSNLPTQRTAFVGRDREVAAVKELLLRQDVHLVTLTGPGGIGKTRLGLQVAEALADHFASGVYYVPLAPVSDPKLIAPAIAQTLGLRETGGQSPLESLKEYLQHSLRMPMLLLLDNFEHLVAEAPTMAELLSSSARLKLLVTSRAPLHIYGEHEFPVPPLALPDPKSVPALEALAQYPAVALFIQRARAVKPDFEVNKDNAVAVATICARLDGLPLAIELAAARIKLLSPSAMQARLESRLQLLTGGARDLPVRQQTLRGAIDWSYGLLTPAEQTLFCRLSVFVSGCTLEAVEAVCNTKRDLELDVLDGMASLVDKSLLQQVERVEGESRFVMLDTIREYGLERLAASGEEAATKRAHAAYYLVLAEEGATASATAMQTEWLDLFETEHDNFRAALDWLTQTGNAEWGLRLGTALFRFWESREYLAEGRDRLAKLLKLEGAAARTNARARSLFAAGVLAGEQGDYASACTLVSESLGIARELKDNWGVAISLNALAVHARDRGSIAESRSLFEESLGVWRELGDRAAVARALSNLANVVKLQGDYALARSLYEECLSIFKELGDRTGMAWSLNHQGDVARGQGDAAGGRALYEQSLTIFRELGDRWGIAGSLADLGNLARDQRDYAASQSLYRESITIFQELGHKRGIARLLECFACSAAAQSKPERSLRLAGAAAALRHVLGAPLPPAEQAQLEKSLEPAREALTNTAASAAWLEGWGTPVEKAVQDALTPDGD
jgi:predicted ATPase/serine/threonine protein kinase